jgi:hypothetical protein
MGRLAPYLSYFDVVGMGYFARKHPDIYQSRLIHLRDGIKNNAQAEGVGLGVLMLNSYCFAASEDLNVLCTFLTKVRDELMTHSLFLRAVVGPGYLLPNSEAFPTPVINEASQPNRRQAKKISSPQPRSALEGYMLGKESAFVVGEHYRFSGIGIRLAGLEDDDLGDIRSQPIKNVFIHSRSRRAEHFLDLPLSDTFTSDSLNNICVEYVRLRARFRGIGNHFVPFFIDLIRSVDWESLRLEVDPENEKGKACAALATSLFERLTLQWFSTHLNDVPSRELILFALLDELYFQLGASSSQFEAVAKRCAGDWFVRHLEDVPDTVLSNDARESFLTFIARPGASKGSKSGIPIASKQVTKR